MDVAGAVAAFLGRVRDARIAAGFSQRDLAELVASAGMAWHQTTVAKTEAGGRQVTFAEALVLADLLDVDVLPQQQPAPVAGEQPATAAAETPPVGQAVDTASPAGVAGMVEARVRADLDEFGELVDMEPSLAAVAMTLARQIDWAGRTADIGKQLPALARELRATLADLQAGRTADDDDDDDLLASPE